MPPIDLVDEHEQFEYVVGEPDDPTATVFLWRRLLAREREDLLERYTVRGLTNERDLRIAYVAQALTGWRNLEAHGRPVRAEALADLSPEERYASKFEVVNALPLQPWALMEGLFAAILAPTREQLLGNSNGFSTANGRLQRLMAPATAAPNAALNAPAVANPSPVTIPLDA